MNRKIPLLESQATQSETQDESMFNASNSQVNAEDEYMNAMRSSPKFGGPEIVTNNASAK